MNLSDVAASLVPGRSCGECTVCCQYFDIGVLDKPAGVLCRHSVASRCTVYPAWPTICRDFYCTWRQVAELPDHARPDLLDVVFWTTGKPQPAVVFETLYLVGTALRDPRSLDQPEVEKIVSHFIRQAALPLFLQWGGQQYLIHPAPDLADAILNPQTTPHRHLIEEGRAWLSRYAPLARAFVEQRSAPQNGDPPP